MQGKVSMVVPCYNKEDYISEMLLSVYNQKWDNIELILVNDGSTDKTRDVIATWESKLLERGYDVVIIDQENQGCCGAVYAGLLRMTGDYFCLVDCDDEIYPEYVSRMAGWLDEHEEYQWAGCLCEYYNKIDGKAQSDSSYGKAIPLDTDNMLEHFLLREIVPMVWLYMSRVDYVKKCGMLEHFYYKRSVTYDPLIAVPLMLGNGKFKFFNEKLYKYNLYAADLAKPDNYEKVKNYYDMYLFLLEWLFDRLITDKIYKERLCGIATVSYHIALIYKIKFANLGYNYYKLHLNNLLFLIDKLIVPAPRISYTHIYLIGYLQLKAAIIDCILNPGYKPLFSITGNTRVIAYGVFGKRAQLLMPYIAGTYAEPTVFWDKSADGTQTIDSIKVKKPDFSSIVSSDVVLVFPSSQEIYDHVSTQCNEATVIHINIHIIKKIVYCNLRRGQFAIINRFDKML